MPRYASAFLLLCALAALAASCSRELRDQPAISNGQDIIDGKLILWSPQVIALVADDADTPEAAALRAQLVKILRAGLESEVDERWGSCGSADPASWHPGDIRVIVVRPSAPDDIALWTPIQTPALAWITRASTKEEVDVVVSAAAEALEQRLAGSQEPYRPLHAAKRAAEMLSGIRQPVTDEEASFVASLPRDLYVRLIVAGTRDDEDVTPLDDLALDEKTRALLLRPAVVGPFTPKYSTCDSVDGPGDTRLQTWGYQLNAEVAAWPCDDTITWDDMLSACCADCGLSCHDRPLVVAPDGKVECRIYVDQLDLTACDAERGWKDPDGKPQMIERYGTSMRRCEIVQLTGPDLESCRSSLECSGCKSGFCATGVQELDLSQYCGSDEHAWPLRFIGGALDAPGGWLHLGCLTDLPGDP
jgi:hypothetical protein